jgi:hypothetical protein
MPSWPWVTWQAQAVQVGEAGGCLCAVPLPFPNVWEGIAPSQQSGLSVVFTSLAYDLNPCAGGSKKRGRRQQQEEEAVQEEEEQQQEQPEEEGGRSAAKAKRRRMQRSRA